MAEKLLDMSQYRRKAHFDYFRSLPWPYVGVTVEVEVSALLTLCREAAAGEPGGAGLLQAALGH